MSPIEWSFNMFYRWPPENCSNAFYLKMASYWTCLFEEVGLIIFSACDTNWRLFINLVQFVSITILFFISCIRIVSINLFEHNSSANISQNNIGAWAEFLSRAAGLEGDQPATRGIFIPNSQYIINDWIINLSAALAALQFKCQCNSINMNPYFKSK